MDDNVRRSKIPYFFFAFFAVVITVNIFYIYISKKTWRGVVTEDSYQKGINYNDTLAQVKKQNDLGWQVDVKYRPITNIKGTITVSILDKNSMRITDAQIYANFKRPTQAGFDFVESINLVGGVYMANVTFPLQGQWDIEVVITRGDDVFQQVKRYVIQ